MPRIADRLPGLMLATLACVAPGGCTSTGDAKDETEAARSPADPWEPMNRGLYEVTTEIDRFTLKPVAKGYQKITPQFIERGLTNFFRNLRSPLNIINHFLQGKPGDGFGQTGRFLLNSSIGIGGLFDVAAQAGLDQKDEDFGQTLAVWGVPDGPYVFVPFLGPHTFRDATMIPLNMLADPLLHYDDRSVRDKVYVVHVIEARARVLSAEKYVEDAYDPYIRIREAYLQHRDYEIHDGDPPEDEDFYDDFPEEEFLDEFPDEE